MKELLKGLLGAAPVTVLAPASALVPVMQKRPRLAVERGGPWRSRERLSHKRSVVGRDQQYVKTRKNTDIRTIVACQVSCVPASSA